jgi:N-acetylglucosamine-6-phosphate deacetylase
VPASTLIHGARKLDARGAVDDFWMLLHGDEIAAVGSGPARPAADETIDVDGARLVPGFIDLHTHGGGGHAFDDGPEAIVAALATHRASGTTRSVVSLVANPLARLRTSLAAIAQLTTSDPLILGSHLEGPFLAHDRRGAHHPDFLRAPEPSDLRELLAAAGGTLRQVTIAPEVPGAMDAIDVLTDAGVVVAVGHTSADYAQTRAAFDRGARLLTHAFNAMPGIHHRAPGPVVAALEDERVTIELILDGVHVHSSVCRLVLDSAPDRVALVTDAMAAAGSDDGDYQLGALNVTVDGGLAVLSGTDTIAGSTLTQDAALRRAIHDVGIDPRQAIAALTRTPARVLGLDHRLGLLEPGYAADAVVLDDDWNVTAVWAAGARLR